MALSKDDPVSRIFLEVLEHWTSSMDEGYGVDVIYLDYRKVFDTVPHRRLLTKLKIIGITGELLEWIKDFLHNRLMRVIVNGECSRWSQVWSGIPQGSVLGPLLFLLFLSTIYRAGLQHILECSQTTQKFGLK